MIFKKKKNKLSEYPCNTYLRNALYFITKKDYDSAYSEICWAIKDMDIVLELIEKLQKESRIMHRKIQDLKTETEEWQKAYQEEKEEQFKLIKLNQFIQQENEELKADNYASNSIINELLDNIKKISDEKSEATKQEEIPKKIDNAVTYKEILYY